MALVKLSAFLMKHFSCLTKVSEFNEALTKLDEDCLKSRRS